MFSLRKFWKFCSRIKVNTKERGTISLAAPFGTQRWTMLQIARGIEDDIHDFTVLKCRQIGLSTITLALDLYWPFTHEGLDATIVTHDETAMVSFRTQLNEMYRSLPRGMKPEAVAHNRIEYVFRHHPSRNISRLQYQIAGTRQKGGGGLGRSKGNAYLHGTEMSSWGDQEGYTSLKNSLAEINPNRLYLWESTARGYNAFQELWDVARKAVTQRAIFVSWWAHELYRVKQDSPIFKTYWGVNGRMTGEERKWAHDVSLLYGDAMEYVNGSRVISPEQIAWYRWYTEEKNSGDEAMVQQEMPWTEHMAFVVTGSQFFAAKHLSESYKRINAQENPTYFRIEIRSTMTDTHVIQCPKKVANLQMWEAPVKGAHYVLGADPAFGSSEWADRFVISVWRAYADKIVQVAEFATPDILPYSFAWIMAYMAGCYAPCHWNLEINGPGQAVLGEIDNMKKMQWIGERTDQMTMRNFIGGMREFLFARPDQISRTPTARGTSSTLKEKGRYFDLFRDYYARGMVVPNSKELVDEMKWIVRQDGSAPSASGRRKDDRVIGGCLAVAMWHDKMRSTLMRQGVTFDRTEKEPMKQMSVVEAMVARKAQLLQLKPPGQRH